MTLEEQAEWVERHLVAGDGPGVYSIDQKHPTVGGLINWALRAVRIEALEEAITAANRHLWPPLDGVVAAAIRQLVAGERGEG